VQQVAIHSDEKFAELFKNKRTPNRGFYVNDGSHGQWKTALSPTQISTIESQYEHWLTLYNYM
jgi:hypothetical protein